MPAEFLGTWHDGKGEYSLLDEVTPTHIFTKSYDENFLQDALPYYVIGTMPGKPDEPIYITRIDFVSYESRQPPYIYVVNSMEKIDNNYIAFHTYPFCDIDDGALDNIFDTPQKYAGKLYRQIISDGCLEEVISGYLKSRQNFFRTHH